jgi:PAS domain S-box-containing protein
MINQRTETMFGYTRAELLGQDVEILLPERFRKNHANMVRLFAANARTRKMAAGRQLWASAKDGREFAVNISLSPIETDEGVLLTANIRDMTDVATIL